MSEPDEQLLDRLARMLAELDPVPEELFAASDAAIDTRDPGATLADLVADSTTGRAGEFEQVRDGGATTRLLSFDGGGLRIELEVVPEDGTLTLLGQVFGGGQAGCGEVAAGEAIGGEGSGGEGSGGAQLECALESGGGQPRTVQSQPVQLDELGRFLVGGLATGPVRLRCRSTTGRVVTSWVTL